MKRLLVAVLGTLVAGAVYGAPRAESAVECGIAADMAVVAGSLAQEKVQPPHASAHKAHNYDVSESARGKELMKDIIDAAYRKESASSQAFAEELFIACIKSGGDMDTILGKRL